MDELVLWLGEQLDEDEEEARRGYLKAEPLPDYDGWDKSTVAGLPPIVAARVLREIDAKRQLVALHGLGEQNDGDGFFTERCMVCDPAEPEPFYPCTTLRLLALPYADRVGYREEWRP